MLVPRGCRLDGLKPCGSGEIKVWSSRKRKLDETTVRSPNDSIPTTAGTPVDSSSERSDFCFSFLHVSTSSQGRRRPGVVMCCGLLAAIFAFRIYWVSGARGTGCRRLVCLHPVRAQPKQTWQGLGSAALRVRFAKRPSAAPPKKMATSGPAEARRGSAGGAQKRRFDGSAGVGVCAQPSRL